MNLETKQLFHPAETFVYLITLIVSTLLHYNIKLKFTYIWKQIYLMYGISFHKLVF